MLLRENDRRDSVIILLPPPCTIEWILSVDYINNGCLRRRVIIKLVHVLVEFTNPDPPLNRAILYVVTNETMVLESLWAYIYIFSPSSSNCTYLS